MPVDKNAGSEEPAAFAALAADLQADSDEVVTADTIVMRMVALVPDAEHVSLTIRRRKDGFQTLASSSDLAQRADSLQYAVDEGPCMAVAAHDSWLRSGDIGGDGRWPRWGPGARDLGVRSVLSVQMLGRDVPLGALNLYSTATGRFNDRDTVDVALVFAVHATNALASAQLVSGLQTALTSRHNIGMAQGILMARYGVSQDRSFELLQRLSSSAGSKLRDVAQHIVATGELPAIDDKIRG